MNWVVKLNTYETLIVDAIGCFLDVRLHEYLSSPFLMNIINETTRFFFTQINEHRCYGKTFMNSFFFFFLFNFT